LRISLSEELTSTTVLPVNANDPFSFLTETGCGIIEISWLNIAEVANNRSINRERLFINLTFNDTIVKQ
ncbi:MAG: hypothetical protein J7497_05005, partial [Chitinophagaceae bacterium]|nr:hypothetical protein [Chitinophagaceae bacterium]